ASSTDGPVRRAQNVPARPARLAAYWQIASPASCQSAAPNEPPSGGRTPPSATKAFAAPTKFPSYSPDVTKTRWGGTDAPSDAASASVLLSARCASTTSASLAPSSRAPPVSPASLDASAVSASSVDASAIDVSSLDASALDSGSPSASGLDISLSDMSAF